MCTGSVIVVANILVSSPPNIKIFLYQSVPKILYSIMKTKSLLSNSDSAISPCQALYGTRCNEHIHWVNECDIYWPLNCLCSHSAVHCLVSNQCFYFQNEIKVFLDNLIQKIYFVIMKINDFRGHLIDITVKKEALYLMI